MSFMAEESSRSSLSGLSDAGSESNSSRSKTPIKSLFRPSKLSAVADQMWKKDISETKKIADVPALKIFDKQNSSTTNNAVSSTTVMTSSVTVSHVTHNNFIFGQNMKDRVTLSDEKSSEHDENAVTSSTGNGKVEFKDVAKGAASASSDLDDLKMSPQDQSTSLEESAKAYEAKNQAKLQLLDSFEVKTGEEGETNIVHALCKLHIFDAVKQTWNERGVAVLRINDKSSNEVDGNDKSTTRIVVRLQGCLRVVINTTVFSDMLIERASPKRLKLSAVDPDTKSIIIYLITATQNEVDKVEEILHDRLKKLINGDKRKADDTERSSSSSPEKKRKVT